MAVIQKNDLVKYLLENHKNRFGSEISPIKLQKALYFLFAFYAGKTSLLNLGNPFSENDIGQNDTMLFDADFEAWVYGPVDSTVYFDFKNDKFSLAGFESNNFLDSLDDFTRGYVQDMTDKIFNTSDFTLVDLSHDDSSWKSKFDRNNPRASGKISNESIINEYANREIM